MAADEDARLPVAAREARAIDLGRAGEPGIAMQRPPRPCGGDQAGRQQDQQADPRDADRELQLLAQLGIVGVQVPVVDDAGELRLLRVRLVQHQEQHAGQVDRRAGQRRVADDGEGARRDLAARGPGRERQGCDAAHAAAACSIPAPEPLAPGLVEDLGDEAPALVAIELHDHVDHDAQQPLDLVHAQAAAGAGLADHQRHLLEGQRAAARVHAGDAARVARGREPHEVEALVAAHLGQEDAVRLHAQAGFEQRLGRDPGRALRVLAVEQVHHVRVVRQRQLGRVLDRDQPLVLRHFLDQALHEGGLARAGLAADDDGLVLAHGQAQELGVAAGVLQLHQFALEGQQFARSACASRWPCARTGLRARSRPAA